MLRLNQLLDSARADDENAVSDLWKEFEFDFYSDVPPEECETITIYCDD